MPLKTASYAKNIPKCFLRAQETLSSFPPLTISKPITLKKYFTKEREREKERNTLTHQNHSKQNPLLGIFFIKWSVFCKRVIKGVIFYVSVENLRGCFCMECLVCLSPPSSGAVASFPNVGTIIRHTFSMNTLRIRSVNQ